MRKMSRKTISRKNSSRKNKKTKKNIKNYSRKNNINKMKGGDDAFNQELLGRIFNNDSSLTTLNISGQNIDNDGAIALANAIKNNNKITSINLSNNNISDKGALAILESITITQKIISHCPISAKIIPNHKIKLIPNNIWILHFTDMARGSLPAGSGSGGAVPRD